jgi:small subunit ribosomal protein S5
MNPTTNQNNSNSTQNRPQGAPGRDGQRPRRDGRRDMPQEEKQFDERVIHVNRVARVVKGGRRFRFQALVVVGDRKHKVGVGVAKGADVTTAVTKATEVAKKHLIIVNLYKGTLPHEAESKVGGAHILIKPAAPGTGLIAGGVVRTVLEVAGVKNVLSKSLGSTNKINTAYATIAALESLVPSKLWVTSKPMPKKAPKDVSEEAPKAEAKKAPAAKAPAADKKESK